MFRKTQLSETIYWQMRLNYLTPCSWCKQPLQPRITPQPFCSRPSSFLLFLVEMLALWSKCNLQELNSSIKPISLDDYIQVTYCMRDERECDESSLSSSHSSSGSVTIGAFGAFTLCERAPLFAWKPHGESFMFLGKQFFFILSLI